MNEQIKQLMSERKILYDWWKSNRKHQSSEIIYTSFRKLYNKVKYAIRASKKECFKTNYEGANNLKEKWNLIHKFGVTAKARKNENRSADFSNEFTVDE